MSPLRFVLPVRHGDKRGRRSLGVGLAIYDALAGARSRQWLDAAALLQQLPMLAPQGLQGGWSYLDAQTDDARLVLRLLIEARGLGALTLNYVAAAELLRDGTGVHGATLRDALSGTCFDVRARCVINATGVWADGLRGTLGRAPKLRPLRGSHLLLPAWRLPVAQAVAFFHPDDRRPVFALPWEGMTLVGTTDLDHHEDLAREPGITYAELDYLLKALQAEFPTLGLAEGDVVSSYAGVRPVVASGHAVAPSEEGREHLILEEDGLISVTGGKLTTFRSTALQALQRAGQRVAVLKHASAAAPVLAQPAAAVPEALRGLPHAWPARWIARFGADAADVRACALDGELAPIANTATCWAELRWACRAEAVVHLDDLLLRRTRLGLLLRDGAAEILPRLAGIVQHELRWSDGQWSDEVARYGELIERCHGIPAAPSP